MEQLPARREFEGFRLIAEEPFRLFFATGTALGIIGVGLWIAYYLGWVTVYPNISHARLMIEGFMACFIFGFLGTAGPRLMEVPHFSAPVVIAIFTLEVFAAGAHLGEAHLLGDACFLLCLVVFVGALLNRFRKRKDSPPPNFALVGLGLLSGIVGVVMLLWSGEQLYSAAYQIGDGLLNQCFVLLPVLGVAPFFIRRLLDLPSSGEEETSADRGQRWQLVFAILTGVIVLGSVPLDVLQPSRVGAGLRAMAVAVYMVSSLPFRGRTPLAQAMRFALFAAAIGYLLLVAMPLQRLGLLHIVFMTCFNLIAFTVATRVVFGHSGNLHRLAKPMWFFRITVGLLFIAMLARVAADFSPRFRGMHLISAAICWLASALLWMLCVLPKARLVEAETE
jgi:uncharacterized protein involved in response to NO